MGIEKYMSSFFSTSLVMSVIVLGLILFNRIFSGKYPAKWRYYIWLIVIAGFLIPFRPHINFNLNLNLNITLPYEPTQAVADPVDADVASPNFEADNFYDFNYSEKSGYTETKDDSQLNSGAEQKHIRLSEIPVNVIIFAVWVLGTLLVFGGNIRRHQSFMAIVRRWGIDISDTRLLAAFHQAKAELGLSNKNIRFKMCKSVTSPMLSGFFRPMVILPKKNIYDDELLLILKHELIHYRRRDLWINLLVAITSAAHWFNPFVYVMAGAVRNDCEISCDEAVLNNAGVENRRIYGEAIIGVIGRQKTIKTALSTNFYGGKNTMKKRIISIMNTGKKRVGIALLCGILALSTTLLSGSVFAVDLPKAEKPAEVTKTVDNRSLLIRAREFALEKAGGGIDLKYELDYEGGVKVYEFKIINGETIHEVDVCEDSSGKLVVCAYETETAKKKDLEIVTNYDEIKDSIMYGIQSVETYGELVKYDLVLNNDILSHRLIFIRADGRKFVVASGVSLAGESSVSEVTAIKDSDKKDTQKKETQPMPSVAISYEDAVAIIVEKLNDAAMTIKEWELDSKKDIWLYEFEVVSGGKEYDIDINADTGEIISFEIDD